jgi:hypothetical protein
MCSLGETIATPPLPPAFGLIYEGAIGQSRQTTSLCDPLLLSDGSDRVQTYTCKGVLFYEAPWCLII